MPKTKEEQKAYAKKYREENKEKLARYKMKYYEKHASEINEKKAKYYEQNKERLAEHKRKTKYWCECGAIVSPKPENIEKHKETDRHKEYYEMNKDYLKFIANKKI